MKEIKNGLLLMVVLCVSLMVYGQQSSHSQFADITGTVGSSQGSASLAYAHHWKMGKKQRIEVGISARATTYFGTKKDFLTAGPAKKTRTSTTPFLIFFAGQEEQNFDTLTVQRPLTNSLNITVNLGYNLSSKWYAGFNIDLIGLTFGRKGSGILTTNGTTIIEPNAKPATFNVLLTGDHDRGSLNSEFFVKYKLNNRWALKAVYQFIFVEYETESRKQTFSDGSTNTRFRNKANNFGLGLGYHFEKTDHDESLITLSVFVAIFVCACTKKTSTASINEMIDTTTAVLKYEGSFQKGPYGTVTGSVMVYQTNAKWHLKLASFSATNGPDLKVYLSNEIQPLNFIKLGDLKSTAGNQVYEIKGSPDLLQYKYALIHCEQFNHLFGFAELMMP